MIARLAIASLALAAGLSPVLAACPMELAVYADEQGGAGIDFRPRGESAIVTNGFRMHLADGSVFDGMVAWSDDAARPWGTLMHNCPEGDVTGGELAACTVWEGVVYAVDGAGKVGLLPKEGEAAPANLLFPALGPSLRHAQVFAPDGPAKLPFDVFALKGCQE
ncbi:MAG: hypothetical protein AB7S80_14260 [Rhizobiaceae bacterium]